MYKLTRKKWCFGLQNAGAKKDRKRILNEQLNESSSMRHIDWRGALLEKARPRRRKLEALPVTCRRTEDRVLTLQQPMLKGGCADTRIIFDDEVDTCIRARCRRLEVSQVTSVKPKAPEIICTLEHPRRFSNLPDLTAQARNWFHSCV